MGVFPLVPMIALGNAVYIIVFGLIIQKKEEVPQQVLGLVVSSIGKFLFLYMAVRTLLPLFIPEVKPPIIATFSLPQLWTALIGGALAIIIIKLLPKSIR
jgi:riboflavin transporter FmnP